MILVISIDAILLPIKFRCTFPLGNNGRKLYAFDTLQTLGANQKKLLVLHVLFFSEKGFRESLYIAITVKEVLRQPCRGLI
ncbi:MAG: hypothetical protein CL596_00210 [Alteromonas sp.]|nr:hypothetical protein [Alteromonas sp.]